MKVTPLVGALSLSARDWHGFQESHVLPPRNGEEIGGGGDREGEMGGGGSGEGIGRREREGRVRRKGVGGREVGEEM